MGEQVFSNAFAAFGIVPDKYGHRTVLEHRARLITISPDAAAEDEDDIDVFNRLPHASVHSAQHNAYPTLTPPSNSAVENSLRVLGATLDASGMSAIDPRYLVVLKAVSLPSPSADRLGLSRRANAIPKMFTQPKKDDTPSRGIGARLRQYIEAYVGTHPYVAPHRSTMSWHWADERIALAASDDAVCIYNLRRGEWEHPPLVSPQMKNVTCIAFRPFGGNTLAVGCAHGVALWSKQEVSFLTYTGHTQIASIDWSPDGAKLVTSSVNDHSVRLWDVGTKVSTAVGQGGLSRFCPRHGSDVLFVASATSPMFRLWSVYTWSAERWGSLAGPIRAAAWSPDGAVLMIAAEGEAAIHVLRVTEEGGRTSTEIIHTEVTSIPQEGPGGCAQHIAWDQHGERVAIVFEVPASDQTNEPISRILDKYELDEHRRYAVALYATQLHPTFRMSPVGYVSGPPESGPPSAITFKPRCEGRTGGVLAVAWANGSVSFTQLIFKPAQNPSKERTP